MGHFNAAGTLSNISIKEGDRVVLIPLSTPRHIIPICHLRSNEGTKCMHSPVFLPIVGDYDGYGGLKNIQEDANTKYIEKYYSITIEEFVKQLTKSIYSGNVVSIDDEEKDKHIKSLSGMFELESIYKQAAQYARENIINAYKELMIDRRVLELLNFNCDDKDNCYHELYPELSFKDNGHCVNVNGNHRIYNPKCIDEAFKEKGIELEEFELFKTNSISYFNIKVVYKLLKEYKQYVDDKNESMAWAMLELIESKIYMLNRYAYIEPLHEMTDDFMCFDAFMHNSNNYYAPSMAGPQDGDRKCSIALSKMILNELEK